MVGQPSVVAAKAFLQILQQILLSLKYLDIEIKIGKNARHEHVEKGFHRQLFNQKFQMARGRHERFPSRLGAGAP